MTFNRHYPLFKLLLPPTEEFDDFRGTQQLARCLFHIWPTAVSLLCVHTKLHLAFLSDWSTSVSLENGIQSLVYYMKLNMHLGMGHGAWGFPCWSRKTCRLWKLILILKHGTRQYIVFTKAIGSCRAWSYSFISWSCFPRAQDWVRGYFWFHRSCFWCTCIWWRSWPCSSVAILGCANSLKTWWRSKFVAFRLELVLVVRLLYKKTVRL